MYVLKQRTYRPQDTLSSVHSIRSTLVLLLSITLLAYRLQDTLYTLHIPDSSLTSVPIHHDRPLQRVRVLLR